LNKTSVAPEQKRQNICSFSRTFFACFLLKWRKSVEKVIYAKKKTKNKKRETPTILGSKLQAKLAHPVPSPYLYILILVSISSLARALDV